MSRHRATPPTRLIIFSEDVKGKCISLNVQGQNEAEQFCYNMSRNRQLRDLMCEYTQGIGVAFNSVRFFYDGSPLNPALSADSLKMKDDDIIDVVDFSGYRVTGATESTLITLPLANEEKPIFLKVQRLRNKDVQLYCIGRNTVLKDLVLDYADRIFELYEHITLLYNGSHVCLSGTPDELQMEDGDTIFALVATFG